MSFQTSHFTIGSSLTMVIINAVLIPQVECPMCRVRESRTTLQNSKLLLLVRRMRKRFVQSYRQFILIIYNFQDLSKSKFSSQYQYNCKMPGDEKKEYHQFGKSLHVPSNSRKKCCRETCASVPYWKTDVFSEL